MQIAFQTLEFDGITKEVNVDGEETEKQCIVRKEKEVSEDYSVLELKRRNCFNGHII